MGSLSQAPTMAAHWNEHNKWRMNLDNGQPLENRRNRPDYSQPTFHTHATELIPSRVAGSSAAGAAMIRAPKDRLLTNEDFQGADTYQTISNDYNIEIHQRVDRPMNYRKPFTQTDNIKPTSSIPNFKTLQNITYKSWPIQDKERFHWAINGIKHTTLKNCTELTQNSQYDYDYHNKKDEHRCDRHQLGGPNNRNDSNCLDCTDTCSACEVSTYSTKYSSYEKTPKRGICNPIDGMPKTLTHEEYYGGRRANTQSAPGSLAADEGEEATQRIFSKKDKKKRGDCHIGNMRKSMHFYTTYKDWYYQNALPSMYK